MDFLGGGGVSYLAYNLRGAVCFLQSILYKKSIFYIIEITTVRKK